MAFFNSGSRALVEILTRMQSTERPMPVDHTFFEFGSIRYHVEASASDPAENVYLSISTPPLSHEASPSSSILPEITLQETRKTYRRFAEIVEPPREGYVLTLKLNFSGLTRPKDRSKAIDQVSRLQSVVLSSQLKDMLRRLGPSGTMRLVYSRREPFFVSRTAGKINAVFPMRFGDDTDLAIATSFFQVGAASFSGDSSRPIDQSSRREGVGGRWMSALRVGSHISSRSTFAGAAGPWGLVRESAQVQLVPDPAAGAAWRERAPPHHQRRLRLLRRVVAAREGEAGREDGVDPAQLPGLRQVPHQVHPGLHPGQDEGAAGDPDGGDPEREAARGRRRRAETPRYRYQEGQEKVDQLRKKGEQEAAEGLQGRRRQHQEAAAADPSERPGRPAQAALPVFRGAQAHDATQQQGAQVPQARVNPKKLATRIVLLPKTCSVSLHGHVAGQQA